MNARARGPMDRDTPLYMISVAAELAGVHPQTLRIYERKRLVAPQRSAGNTRLYSDADIERLRLIGHLTAAGVNLAGIERIIELQAEVAEMIAEMERLQSKLIDAEGRMRENVARMAYRGEIVLLKRGGLASRPPGSLGGPG